MTDHGAVIWKCGGNDASAVLLTRHTAFSRQSVFANRTVNNASLRGKICPNDLLKQTWVQ